MPVFLQSQIDEIKENRALILYGVALSFTHLLTVFFWINRGALRFLTNPQTATCWPGFENCHEFRFSNDLPIKIIFALYFGVAMIALFQFLRTRVATGYFLLFGLFFFKLIFFALDYRLRGNHHYFAFIILGLYLFVPRKKDVIAWMIISFYVASGLIKFNDEWLSGAALSGRGDFFFKGRWLELACAYVVFLELVFIFGLIAGKKSWLFWATAFQLLAFHLVSYQVVRWFYPAVMLSLLTIFVLAKDPIRFPVNRAGIGALGIFWFFQIVPLFYKGDSGLTVQVRLFAVSLVQTRPMCQGLMIGKKESSRFEIRMPTMKLPVRIWCDPLVFYNFARNTCREGRKVGKLEDLDFYLLAKRSRSNQWTQLMKAENFCSDNRKFPFFASNPWMNR